MLTPIEIQGKTFKSGIGYDKKDVDGFVRELLVHYETLYKENVELKDKLNVLSDGIQYYKNIEGTLQKTLVLAEMTSEETKKTAEKNAEAIEKDAHAKAKIIVADAKRELDQIHVQTLNLIQQYEKYKTQYKQLASTQLELLSSDSFRIDLSDLEVFQKRMKQETKEIKEILPMEEKKQEEMQEEDTVPVENVPLEKVPLPEDSFHVKEEDIEFQYYNQPQEDAAFAGQNEFVRLDEKEEELEDDDFEFIRYDG